MQSYLAYALLADQVAHRLVMRLARVRAGTHTNASTHKRTHEHTIEKKKRKHTHTSFPSQLLGGGVQFRVSRLRAGAVTPNDSEISLSAV